MGLGTEAAQIIIREHRLKPIEGRMLMVGRPSTWFSPELAMQMIEEAGVSIRPNVSIELDTETVSAKARPEQRWISDKSFFALFTDAEVVSVDVSDFEGAEIVHDMSYPLPPEMEGKFQFIFDGSSLDNIFDPAAALRNMASALAPTGRILHQNHGSPHSGPYLMFSGEWFADYYLANGFADCRVLYGYFSTQFDDQIYVQTFDWSPFVKGADGWHTVTSCMQPDAPAGYPNNVVLILAEKSGTSTTNVMPVQHIYRGAKGTPAYELYRKNFLAMRDANPGRTWPPLPDDPKFRAGFFPSEGFTYLGVRTRPHDPWVNVSPKADKAGNRKSGSSFLKRLTGR